MCVYKIEEIAERVRPVAEKYNIDKIYLFGSYARGEATEESDVDLRIDYTELVFKSLFGYGGLFADMEDALEKSVDIVSTNALREKIKDPLTRRFVKAMKKEEKLIYERTV